MAYAEIPVTAINSWPILLPVAGAICLAAWKLLSKPLEKSIETHLTVGLAQSLWHRAVLFVVILFLASAAAAAIWCWMFTDLPPPNTPKDMSTRLLGRRIQRFGDYLTTFTAVIMGIFPIVLRRGAIVAPTKPPEYLAMMRAAPSLYLLAVIISAAYVVWLATFDPGQLTYVELPAWSTDLAIWYYACVPFFAYVFTVVLALIYAVMRWLWRVVGNIEEVTS